MDKALVREIKKVSLGVLILGAVEAIVILCAFGPDVALLLGALLGCFCAILNFFLTARDIEKNIDKSENAAKLAAAGGYYLRLILIAAMIFLAIKMPWLNVYTMVIPLIFPRLVITAYGLFPKKKEGDGQP